MVLRAQRRGGNRREWSHSDTAASDAVLNETLADAGLEEMPDSTIREVQADWARFKNKKPENRIEEIRPEYYSLAVMEYEERLILQVADFCGTSKADARQMLLDCKGRVAQETTSATGAKLRSPAREESPPPVAVAAPAWPSEKWETSRERGSRKQHAIFGFLRRVWKPFIDETGAVVTRRILAEVDGPAAAAVKSALRSGPMPDDIRIVATKDLKNHAATRPGIFSAPARSSMSDIP
jgi:hypothetical protein